MMIPLYQAEICHPSIRGRVTALQQFMLGVGALCATWIGYGAYTGIAPTNHAQWQVPLGIQVAPAVFLGLLISLFPEVSLCKDVNRMSLIDTNSHPVGSSATTAARKACVRWLSYTPMGMRTTLGFKPNLPKSRKASHMRLKTRPSHTWTCSRIVLLFVGCSFAVPCKLLFK